jgi:hypothetical protein
MLSVSAGAHSNCQRVWDSVAQASVECKPLEMLHCVRADDKSGRVLGKRRVKLGAIVDKQTIMAQQSCVEKVLKREFEFVQGTCGGSLWFEQVGGRLLANARSSELNALSCKQPTT